MSQVFRKGDKIICTNLDLDYKKLANMPDFYYEERFLIEDDIRIGSIFLVNDFEFSGDLGRIRFINDGLWHPASIFEEYQNLNKIMIELDTKIQKYEEKLKVNKSV